ncbi:MAG: hypothetical protein JW699_03890 [Chitinispirillaceae bacterium]|nr:hypothetical protein [Chitinispirillaceae bacterium]
MKKNALILCTMLSGACLWHGSSAQAAVEDAIATDSVDIFAVPAAEAVKSPALAMVSSLILPGSGHHYCERNRSALVYISTEATLIFGFFFCNHYAKNFASDAAGYAWTHAGARGEIKSADDYYWKQVGKYMDVHDYNAIIDLDRLDDGQKFTGENQYWRWDSEESKDRFNSLLSSSRLFHIVSSFCIGALVLDRVVAFIHMRTVTRNFGTRRTGDSPGGITVRPVVSVASSGVDVQLSCSF